MSGQQTAKCVGEQQRVVVEPQEVVVAVFQCCTPRHAHALIPVETAATSQYANAGELPTYGLCCAVATSIIGQVDIYLHAKRKALLRDKTAEACQRFLAPIVAGHENRKTQRWIRDSLHGMAFYQVVLRALISDFLRQASNGRSDAI